MLREKRLAMINVPNDVLLRVALWPELNGRAGFMRDLRRADPTARSWLRCRSGAAGGEVLRRR